MANLYHDFQPVQTNTETQFSNSTQIMFVKSNHPTNLWSSQHHGRPLIHVAFAFSHGTQIIITPLLILLLLLQRNIRCASHGSGQSRTEPRDTAVTTPWQRFRSDRCDRGSRGYAALRGGQSGESALYRIYEFCIRNR